MPPLIHLEVAPALIRPHAATPSLSVSCHSAQITSPLSLWHIPPTFKKPALPLAASASALWPSYLKVPAYTKAHTAKCQNYAQNGTSESQDGAFVREDGRAHKISNPSMPVPGCEPQAPHDAGILQPGIPPDRQTAQPWAHCPGMVVQLGCPLATLRTSLKQTPSQVEPTTPVRVLRTFRCD